MLPTGSLLLAACFNPQLPPFEAETSTGDELGTDGEGTSTTGDESSDTQAGTESGTDGGTSTDTDTEGSGEASSEATDTGPAMCGNGIVEAGEACDDGRDPPLEAGACRPDCAGVIETRTIVLSSSLGSGNFGEDPVAFADSKCPAGYRAMFAFAEARRATSTPWLGDAAVDWPVAPYTRYVNDEGEELWITDAVALLAVRGGAHVDLEAAITGEGCEPPCLDLEVMVSGLAADGTTLSEDDCQGWSAASNMSQGQVGSFVTGDYATGPVGCSFGANPLASHAFACVEQ